MKYWLISDTHLGHTRMTELAGRPIGYEQTILDNLEGKDGVLIHLGDVSFDHHPYWHSKLRSYALNMDRWLVRGNHDSKSDNWYLNNGWDFVCEEFTIQMFGKRIVFSHRPLVDNGTFDLNIHGHLHNSERIREHVLTDKHILVKCEHTYMPVNLRTLVKG